MTDSSIHPILPKFKKVFESDGFKNDARAFLTVSDSAFNEIMEELETAPGIFGASRLRDAIASANVTDEDQARLLSRLIPVFARWGRTIARKIPDSFFATLNKALGSDFTDAELTILTTRLRPLLEGTFPGLALADKTDAVAHATGRALRCAQLISDVRPVFDDNREHILAVVPMTTLKLTAESLEDDVPPSTWEVQLSELELKDLSHKLVEAQRKLAVMKQLLNDKEVEIADCDMVLRDGNTP